jgi:hypothetical protein
MVRQGQAAGGILLVCSCSSLLQCKPHFEVALLSCCSVMPGDGRRLPASSWNVTSRPLVVTVTPSRLVPRLKKIPSTHQIQKVQHHHHSASLPFDSCCQSPCSVTYSVPIEPPSRVCSDLLRLHLLSVFVTLFRPCVYLRRAHVHDFLSCCDEMSIGSTVSTHRLHTVRALFSFSPDLPTAFDTRCKQ